MDGAGGVGGERGGGAGGGDVRSEKSNHSHFRPELCWPAVLARFVVWYQILRVAEGIRHLVEHPDASVLC